MSVTAAILCGGQGTRLRPVIGDGTPKCLAPVAGKPFLCYILEHLHATREVEKVVLCTGYQSQKVEDMFGPDYAGLPLTYSVEKEPLGTGGALKNALPLLDSDPVLVVNGDTFCKFDLPRTMRMMDYKSTLSDRFEGVVWHSEPPEKKPTGVRLLRKTLLGLLAKQEPPFDLDGWLFSHKNHGMAVGLLFGSYEFLDIGTPGDYAGAEAFLRQQGAIP